MREMRLPAALLLACLASTSLRRGGHHPRLRRDAGVAHPNRRRDCQPGQLPGKTVRVEGVVTAVCEHMGCWMTLAPAGAAGEKPATLRLKVDDGVIVFPVSARGRTAVAQGVIERVGGDDHHARRRPPADAGARPLSPQGHRRNPAVGNEIVIRPC